MSHKSEKMPSDKAVPKKIIDGEIVPPTVPKATPPQKLSMVNTQILCSIAECKHTTFFLEKVVIGPQTFLQPRCSKCGRCQLSIPIEGQ